MAKYIVGSSFVVGRDWKIDPYDWSIITESNRESALLVAKSMYGEEAWAIDWSESREKQEKIFNQKYVRPREPK